MVKVTPMETYSGDDYGLASPVFSHDAKGHDPIDGHTEKGLEVFVIFTDAPGTLAALQMADGLAQKLEAHIRLLLPYEVPYALPLTRPAVPVEFLEGQIRNLAGKTRLEVAAHIYLCRDKRRDAGTSPEAAFLGRRGRQETLVAYGGAETCAGSRKGRAPRDIRGARGDLAMLDFAYILVAVLFFVGCWVFTNACDRL